MIINLLIIIFFKFLDDDSVQMELSQEVGGGCGGGGGGVSGVGAGGGGSGAIGRSGSYLSTSSPSIARSLSSPEMDGDRESEKQYCSSTTQHGTAARAILHRSQVTAQQLTHTITGSRNRGKGVSNYQPFPKMNPAWIQYESRAPKWMDRVLYRTWGKVL